MSKKEMTAQEFTDEFSKQLTIVATELTKQVEEEFGMRTADNATASFLATFIGVMVKRRLNRPNPLKLPAEKQCNLVMSDYNDFKIKIQNSIALGFQDAMSQWSGKSVEFYCQIKPVPEPINKQAC